MSNRSDLCAARAAIRTIAHDLERIERSMPNDALEARRRAGKARAMLVASASLIDGVLAERVDASLPASPALDQAPAA